MPNFIPPCHAEPSPIVIPNEREESHEAGLKQRCFATPSLLFRFAQDKVQDKAQYDKDRVMFIIQSTNKG